MLWQNMMGIEEYKKITIAPQNGQSLFFINEYSIYDDTDFTVRIKINNEFVTIPRQENPGDGGWVFASKLPSEEFPGEYDYYSPYNVIYIYPFYTKNGNKFELYKDYVGGLAPNQTIEITCRVATLLTKSYKLNIIYYE